METPLEGTTINFVKGRGRCSIANVGSRGATIHGTSSSCSGITCATSLPIQLPANGSCDVEFTYDDRIQLSKYPTVTFKTNLGMFVVDCTVASAKKGKG
jgi:hypothetical protein